MGTYSYLYKGSSACTILKFVQSPAITRISISGNYGSYGVPNWAILGVTFLAVSPKVVSLQLPLNSRPRPGKLKGL